jgi:translocation and assembly module TamA|tara:strand:- start:53914 stop:56154 length:2241 start_codon:yes stop_codon:yes gene_type:complete
VILTQRANGLTKSIKYLILTRTSLLFLTGLILGNPVWAQDQPASPAVPADDAADDEPSDPIINDEDFEDALPSLDEGAAISGDEESGDDAAPDAISDAAPDEEAPGEAVPESGVPGDTVDLPALDDGTTTEIIEDVPVEDEALAAPLEPLDSFDVTTPEEPTEEAAEAAPAIRYRLVIDGLDEAGLEGQFRSLSALERSAEAANAAMLTARAESDAELAVRLLRSQGYFDASADSNIALPAEPDGRFRVDLVVVPGPRYEFSSIEVVGEDEAIPAGLVSDNLEIEVGAPIVADDVLSAEATISLLFPFNGYPFAEVEQRDILLDGDDHTGDYVLPVDLGPRARFGGIQVEENAVFDPEHIEVLSRFDRGELYDVRRQDDLREAMVATNLFNSVSIEPVRTGEEGPEGTEYVDLLVRQVEGPDRSLQADAGYGTGQGFRLEGRWINRNLFPPEGALELNAVAGTKEQGVGALFRRSNAGQRDRTVQLGFDVRRQDFQAFNARTASLVGRISRDSTPIWQKRWTYAYGFELIGSQETRFDDTVGDRNRNTFAIAALPGQLGFDSSDSLLDPTEGFRATIRLSPEASLQGGDFAPYGRGLMDVSGYQGIGESFVLAGRVRLGSIQGISRDNLAPSRRYYAGGGGSVRGFGFQDLGPRDSNNDPLGGRSVNEFAVEGRYRFGNFGAVAFVDAGQVYEATTPQFSDMRYGVGIGARYYTNFGPFRADIAMPVNRRPGEARFGVYISIGQAF